MLVTSIFLLFPQCFQKASSVRQRKPWIVWERVNYRPNGQIFVLSKLKAFADNNLNMGHMIDTILERVENMVEKGENAGFHYFHLFQQCFLLYERLI